MLQVISSIQTPMYIVAYLMIYRMPKVVPQEAEKHTFQYIFYGIPLTAKNSKCDLAVYKRQSICKITLCLPTLKNVITAHSKPTHSFCGLT